ncbi:hypothetical protein H5410_045295 [Solanum commersonii]|uniref:Uncharacterized protein n=1 Tax=Solanum commersonii TaxID=4109 RepID=A0A9J5XB85_SOLCO|nr:hypothetical protein H5410_045295 [Solanum commersonii]
MGDVRVKTYIMSDTKIDRVICFFSQDLIEKEMLMTSSFSIGFPSFSVYGEGDKGDAFCDLSCKLEFMIASFQLSKWKVSFERDPILSPVMEPELIYSLVINTKREGKFGAAWPWPA